MKFISTIVWLFGILCSFRSLAMLPQPVFVHNVGIFPIADYSCVEVLPLSREYYSINHVQYDDMTCFFVGENSIKLNNEIFSKISLQEYLLEQKNIVAIFEASNFGDFLTTLHNESEQERKYIYIYAYLRERNLSYEQFVQVLDMFPENREYVVILIQRMLRTKNRNIIMREMLNQSFPLSDSLIILLLRNLKHDLEKDLAVLWVQNIHELEIKKKALAYLPEGIIRTQNDRTRSTFLNLLAHYDREHIDEFFLQYREMYEKKKTTKQKVLGKINGVLRRGSH